MARKIKTTAKITKGMNLVTCFEDGNTSVYPIDPDQIVEQLRYVLNEEIAIVTGKVKSIGMTVKNPPTGNLDNDVTLTTLLMDASEKYNSRIVNVPINEIVEFDGEENVARMKYGPKIVVDLTMKYSNYQVNESSIEIGDTFDQVRILDPNNVGTDITGTFTIENFLYTTANNTLNVIGVVMKNVDDDKVYNVKFDNILAMNELYTYDADNAEELAEILQNVASGDTVTISAVIDSTAAPIFLNGKEDVKLEVNSNVVADGTFNSGIRVANGSVEINGAGKFVNTNPYTGAANGHMIVDAREDSTIIFNGGGVNCVTEDPENQGQFGVGVHRNGKLIINGGEFVAGWYAVCGNGNAENTGSVIEINGGTFTSIADFAIYHPQNGKLIINGGEISGHTGALAVNNGDILITGGNFSVLTNDGNEGDTGDGTAGMSAAAINLNARYGDVTCRITGGTFKALNDAIMIATGTAHNVDLKISGGKFSSKLNDEWIAEGFFCTAEPDVDGFYEVRALL